MSSYVRRFLTSFQQPSGAVNISGGSGGGLSYTAENVAHKGIANGYASLDATAKVPVAQLPAAVNDSMVLTWMGW